MEKALLEGEHADELQLLQQEQNKIDQLKKRQMELIESAALQKDRVRPVYMIHYQRFENTIVYVYKVKVGVLCAVS